MFDQLVAVAEGTCGAAGAGAWARVENAACARRLAGMADELERQLAIDGSAEREQWCLDNWDAVCAEIAAAHNVSLGVASYQLVVARALRERLPRVAEVFATGAIFVSIGGRRGGAHPADEGSRRDSRGGRRAGRPDRRVGAAVGGQDEQAIDYWVDRYDPYALVRAELGSRGRHVDVAADDDGLSWIDGKLYSHDAAALDQRLDAMARAVCENDPRTLEQRRADALGALAGGADRLACGCGDAECPAAQATPSAVVVNVIAEDKSLCDDTPAKLGWPQPEGAQRRRAAPDDAGRSAGPAPATGPAVTNPAVLMGGEILPAPLLAAKLANTATIRPIVHPGDSPPEPRYVPSRALAQFVRCRDLTCRFPEWIEPADRCDLDHSIPYPVGPTQASN